MAEEFLGKAGGKIGRAEDFLGKRRCSEYAREGVIWDF